jgi:hypothetical protein
MKNLIPDTALTRGRTAEALTEASFPANCEKQKKPGLKAKRGSHPQAKQKKVAVARRRESTALTDREIVAARLARAIGRGRDAIYHGTRAPEKVLRSGKLMPNGGGVSFSRSPEVAAYFAHLIGTEGDRYSPALLVLDRSSLIQAYRLEPCRYMETVQADEREETVYGRTINFRRHLLGVVRESDVSKVLGPPKHRFIPQGWPCSKWMAYRREAIRFGERFVREGRARVRDIIVRERKRIGMAHARSPATASAPRANRRPKARQCARRRR